jgi:predicted DNA-binding transcriptional regulator AlpA
MTGITISLNEKALEPFVRQIVAETIAAMRSERAEANNGADSEHRHLVYKAGRLLLTVKETAEAMGIGERTLWGITAPRGDLSCVPLGKRNVRYDVDDVRAWIERHKTGGTKQAAANGQRARGTGCRRRKENEVVNGTGR